MHFAHRNVQNSKRRWNLPLTTAGGQLTLVLCENAVGIFTGIIFDLFLAIYRSLFVVSVRKSLFFLNFTVFNSLDTVKCEFYN